MCFAWDFSWIPNRPSLSSVVFFLSKGKPISETGSFPFFRGCLHFRPLTTPGIFLLVVSGDRVWFCLIIIEFPPLDCTLTWSGRQRSLLSFLPSPEPCLSLSPLFFWCGFAELTSPICGGVLVLSAEAGVFFFLLLLTFHGQPLTPSRSTYGTDWLWDYWSF